MAFTRQGTEAVVQWGTNFYKRKLVGSTPENDSLKSFNQVVTAPLSALEVEITGHVYETLKTKAHT